MNIPLLVFVVFFILIFVLRIPIAFGLISNAIIYFLLSGRDIGLAAEAMVSNLYVKFIIIAVPLFIFTANVMNTGKVTDLLFEFAMGLVGRLRGGMGHVNVVASFIFSGMTGSAVADASGLGMMEIEAMRKYGYDDGFSCAITAASATIGPIFPPSIPMVFYAMLSGTSIGALFLGGMIPGVVLGVALMGYVAFVARRRGYPRGVRVTLKQFAWTTLRAFPALLTPVILLGGIYTGVVTPTEAGALAGFYALVISMLVYRSLGLENLWGIIKDTVRRTGTVSIIVGSAFTTAYVVAIENIPDMFATALLDMTTNRYVLLLIINVLFILLGMLIDTSTIIVVFIPMVLPLVQEVGIDLVHFGVVVVLNMMIGLSTPPFGVLLFIVSGVSDTPLKAVIKDAIPMVLVMLGVLFLLTYVPDIVLFLPNLLWG
jgi:tripartite ATP-independent transporter DctM subunit